MKVVHGFLFGVFILILAYLGFSNSGGATAILNSGSGAFNSGVKTLQAR